MLIAGYAYAVYIRVHIDDMTVDFRTVVVLPALYPLVAVAGAGARRLLDRQAAAEEALAVQERTLAAQAERERLARDMHDSLAKTVHGIGFAALALSRRIELDPPGAVADARQLAEDARTAAQEARELLSGLRGRDDAELPLPTAIRSEAGRWGERTGTLIGGSLDDVGPLPSLALRELRWILKEALANVERYAHATRVDVHLRRLGDRVVLTVADDGAGFEPPEDLDELQGVGSFGLSGMRERARLAGGELSVESEPGDGTVISVWVPAGAPARQRETPEPPPADPSDTLPVEGFTWQ
jgi:signal transduction histidine kinase